MIRLQKWLSAGGACSRRKAEELIQAGRVAVNGQVVTELGAKADPAADSVTLDGKTVAPDVQQKIYIMLHKPEGVVTTAADQFGRPTVLDYVPEGSRLYPVGRLDYDSSGLIFLTNDGEWTQTLTHPKFESKKTYVALIKGIPSPEALNAFRNGITIDGKKTAPCEAKLEAEEPPNRAKLRIVLHEGRNRQIRKMCEAIGHPVLSLKRVQIGEVKLTNLKRGQWRHLTTQEVAAAFCGPKSI
ncbi:MAG: rRNA pseudouridine synthase [Defluviitaleaceae bacterium]|nr:rRNA pseudouridine synthase [Defluviitaleaceae bacterium]